MAHRQLSLDVRARRVILEGPVARESAVSEGLINRRHCTLYAATAKEPPLLASRRQEDKEPSKTWALNKQCTLTEVVQCTKRLRVHTSTLKAVAGKGDVTAVLMNCFTLHFNSGKLWGADRLTLCFESAEMAAVWHQKMREAIRGGIGMRTPRRLSLDEDMAVPSEDGGISEPPESPTKQYMSSMGGDAGLAMEYLPRSWHSVLHVNGVTVYGEEETEDGEGGAFMVSAVVRAPPEDTFTCFMQLPFAPESGTWFGEAHVLEIVDSHTQVVYHKSWRPAGLLGRLCAPRDIVLQRTWRQDEDGTYIVMYQSTRHGRAREAQGSGLLAPVRATVEAAGFTIRPLLPKYMLSGVSHECLVTLVMKVDMGGWMSQGSLLSKLLGSRQPMSWLQPMIQTVVILRDKVEQSRFVLVPTRSGGGGDILTPRTSLDGVYLSRTSQPSPLTPSNGSHTPGAAAAAEVAAAPTAAAALELSKPLCSIELPAFSGSLSGALSSSSIPAVPAVPEEPEPAVPGEDAWAVKGTCHRCWSIPPPGALRIRGKKYLQDKRKIPATVPMFDLYATDLLDVDEPLWHIARFLPSVKYCPEPFMFVMQLMIPCSPPQSLTMVWTAPINVMTASMEELLAAWPEDENGTVRAFFTNFKAWLEGDGKEADKRRNTKFKLIPRVVKGSWIVRQSVGTTPVLLGQKLLTRYFRGPNYFEVDVDITANTVAASVTSLVVGAITSLVVDLNVLVEGQSEEELPERLAGSVRFNHLRLKGAAYLDEEAGRIYKGQAMEDDS